MQKSQSHMCTIFLEWNSCCQWARTLIDISSNLINTAEHRFGTTWGDDDMRVNDDNFHFDLLLEWTISLKHYTMAILINRPLVVLYEMWTFLSFICQKNVLNIVAPTFSVDLDLIFYVMQYIYFFVYNAMTFRHFCDWSRFIIVLTKIQKKL